MIFSTPDGNSVERMSRRRLVDKDVKKQVIREMLIMREHGYTDSEIALKFRYSRQWVNELINSIPESERRRMIDVGLV